jgi:DNA-binding transcriptional regulator YbjK
MPTSRPDAIADAALALLAERGMRGLTHRAVDEAAGLPQGSTSNHARTRAALLRLALARLATREVQAATAGGTPLPPPGADAAALAAFLAHALHHAVTTGRDLTRARFELALEATRDPRLREVYDTIGSAFRTVLTHMLATAGAPDPDRQARSLAAWCEGVLFASTTGSDAATPPTEEELRQGAGEVLHGMLARPHG